MTWPMKFPPQPCIGCQQVFALSHLEPVQVDDKLVGWVCGRCEVGETEFVECAPDVGIAPTQLCLPEQSSEGDETIVKPVAVEGAYL